MIHNQAIITTVGVAWAAHLSAYLFTRPVLWWRDYKGATTKWDYCRDLLSAPWLLSVWKIPIARDRSPIDSPPMHLESKSTDNFLGMTCQIALLTVLSKSDTYIHLGKQYSVLCPHAWSVKHKMSIVFDEKNISIWYTINVR